jgi:hypothetical protein
MKNRIPSRANLSRNRFSLHAIAIALLLILPVPGLLGGEKKKKEDYGFGFAVDLTNPEPEVLDAVEQVVEDGIIQGSKEYNKDQNIGHAEAATSSKLFPNWTGPGKVYYKVCPRALAPVNFKESQDQGTVVVRYVVQAKDPTITGLRIDAIFVEDFRHIVHPSNGSVETAEYKDIKNHIDTAELEKKLNRESEGKRQQQLAKNVLDRSPEDNRAASRLATAQSSSQTLEQHVQELRRQVERVIKAPGAPLKSAPFRTATSLRSLAAGSEVVILVSTSYWYGVETTDGQHGWLFRDDVEQLP